MDGGFDSVRWNIPIDALLLAVMGCDEHHIDEEIKDLGEIGRNHLWSNTPSVRSRLRKLKVEHWQHSNCRRRGRLASG